MTRNRFILGVLVILFMTATTQAWSQIEQPFRFEQEIKNSEDGFTIISLKKEGLGLIRDLNKYEQGKKKWHLDLLDTTLSVFWSSELTLDRGLILVGYEYLPHYLYLLYREGESAGYSFQLLRISLAEKTIKEREIKFEVTFKMSHFTVSGNSAVFGGYIGSQPAVLLYDHENDHTKVLPGLFINDVSLLDVRTNQNNSFNVLLAERIGKEKRRMMMRTYDHDGYLLIDYVVEINPKLTILSGITSALEREEMIIAGTYGDGSKQSMGFYSVIVDPYNIPPISYTDFPSLEHFTDYLSPRRAYKIKTKAQKAKTLGRLPDFKEYVTPFRIEERPKGFYMLAEVYYPTSSMNPYPYGSNYYNPYGYGYYPYGISPYSNRYYNSPYPYNNPVRNSDVHMMQILVVEFNAEGKPGKDASMKLDDVKLSTLEQVGDFTIVHDSIFLAYKQESEIFYQKESGDPDEKPVVKKSKIKLQSQYDELKGDENEGGVHFWFNHHFYVWGYQRIRDVTRPGDQTRHVFYINRVSAD